MLSEPEHEACTRVTDVESPELALVDHALAACARSELPDAEDTLGRLEREIAFRRIARAAATEHPPEDAPPPRRSLVAGRRGKLGVAAAVAASLMAGLLVGVDVDFSGTPAGADSSMLDVTTLQAPRTTLETAPATVPQTPTSGSRPAAPSTRRPVATPAAGPRRFAWAPVSGASGYRVEFFRGATRVYSVMTDEPQLDLPRSWRFGGRRRALTAGTYRWYVWPIEGGRQRSEASVQAELVVP